MSTQPQPELKLQIALWTTHLTFSAMLLCFCIWQLSRPGGPTIFWAIQVLPLAIFIPGMLAKHYRTYIWMCFVLLMYFVKGVDGMVSPSRAWIDFVILAGSVILFTSAMFTSRWLQRFQFQLHTHNS